MYAKLKHNYELAVLLKAKVSPSCQFFILQPPKPYYVRPRRFSTYKTSMAVAVLRLACSVYVTASCITFTRKPLKHYPKKE